MSDGLILCPGCSTHRDEDEFDRLGSGRRKRRCRHCTEALDASTTVVATGGVCAPAPTRTEEVTIIPLDRKPRAPQPPAPAPPRAPVKAKTARTPPKPRPTPPRATQPATPPVVDDEPRGLRAVYDCPECDHARTVGRACRFCGDGDAYCRGCGQRMGHWPGCTGVAR